MKASDRALFYVAHLENMLPQIAGRPLPDLVSPRLAMEWGFAWRYSMSVGLGDDGLGARVDAVAELLPEEVTSLDQQDMILHLQGLAFKLQKANIGLDVFDIEDDPVGERLCTLFEADEVLSRVAAVRYSGVTLNPALFVQAMLVGRRAARSLEGSQLERFSKRVREEIDERGLTTDPVGRYLWLGVDKPGEGHSWFFGQLVRDAREYAQGFT